MGVLPLELPRAHPRSEKGWEVVLTACEDIFRSDFHVMVAWGELWSRVVSAIF